MERKDTSENMEELRTLCAAVRGLIGRQEYEKCEGLIRSAMERYPHAPQPHNLFGILLEKQGDHMTAMRHFRAAWALDPTYLPARQNLDCYGTFFSGGRCAYEESDCPAEEKTENRSGAPVEYTTHGIGRMARRIEYGTTDEQKNK